MERVAGASVLCLPRGLPKVGTHGADGDGGLQSETYPCANENSRAACCGLVNVLQTPHFWLRKPLSERLSLGQSPALPQRKGAKRSPYPLRTNRLDRSPIGSAVAALESRRGGGTVAGDDEEGRKRRSIRDFSGRPARTVLEPVPEASNGPVPPQLGGAGSQRSNQFSVCQSWEQRDSGPRTPLHANEGRPRARYDEKENSKCSQVEYDSC